MKKYLKSQVVVAVVLCAFTLSISNCGILMHPERKGQNSGTVDAGTVVLDCLWLFAGVIPGVVALVVDYSTGGIYESGSAMNLHAGEQVALRLPGPAPADADLKVRLVAPDGSSSVLLAQHFDKGEEKRAEAMGFVLPARLAAGNYGLAISVNGIENAAWPLKIVN